MSPTRVGVNLLWLLPGQVGGSEQSTGASLLALRDLAPAGLDFQLFVLDAFAKAHPEVVADFPTTVLPLSGRSRALRVLAESSWLVARGRRLDLLHHAGGTAPPLRSVPHVLTVHDLQPLEHSATHSRVKRAYLARVLPRSVCSARAVAVPSEFVRRSLLAKVEVEPDRVMVIPHGVAWPPPQVTPVDQVRQRYRLDGPVVIYPAITYPHKNHETLLDAFVQVRETHPDATLVMTGGEGACERDLMDQVERLGLSASVRRTGRVPAADLAGLYAVATVVAVPSRYEGFGLPAAEAMAAGVALVAADTTALPEVVGDAGVLLDPDDTSGWAAAISRLLADEQERSVLVAKGRERARIYTWQANAERLSMLYRTAVGLS